MRFTPIAAAFVVATTIGCNSGSESSAPAPEAVSLLGAEFYPRVISDEARERYEANLGAARNAYENTPDNADSIIWYGRRLGYLERYRDAIDVFSEGIEKHPEDARLYRFRGHRYITVRDFDGAIRDLSRAADLIVGQQDSPEPDGAPNALGIPTSTEHGNIYYHLALAHYLSGDYDQSLPVWNEAYRIATNDDTRIAVNDWRYMTLRRLGRDADAEQILAEVTQDLNIIENTGYFRRMLMYKGDLHPDSLLAQDADELQYVTQGYGVGNWYLANGDSARAFEIFDNLLSSNYWAAFGFIAAEADVARTRLQE